jgi:hypothetical protein
LIVVIGPAGEEEPLAAKKCRHSRARELVLQHLRDAAENDLEGFAGNNLVKESPPVRVEMTKARQLGGIGSRRGDGDSGRGSRSTPGRPGPDPIQMP